MSAALDRSIAARIAALQDAEDDAARFLREWEEETRRKEAEEARIAAGAAFRCYVCHGVFDKAWTDQQAAEEYLQLFGGASCNDIVSACDDCWPLVKERLG